MSDTETHAAAETPVEGAPAKPLPPEAPHVIIAPSPQGGLVAVMHLGETVRAFAAAEMDRVRSLLSKVGISEFRLSQEDANRVADAAVAAPVLPGPDKLEHFQQMIHDLGAELSAARSRIETTVRDATDARRRVTELEQENGQLRTDLLAAREALDAARKPAPKPQDQAARDAAPSAQGTGSGKASEGTGAAPASATSPSPGETVGAEGHKDPGPSPATEA